MPEAAEVALAASQLRLIVTGRTLERLEVTHPRTTRAQPAEDLEHFVGRSVTGVRRHGKWILVAFDGTTEELGIHLRMSGQLLVVDPGTPHPDRHVHAVLSLGRIASSRQDVPDGITQSVWFRDPRTFGELRRLPNGAPVAPDLFDPAVTGDVLHAGATRRRVGVKAVLLDQRCVVSGIGSYLADEALHRAGIPPDRPAATVPAAAWQDVLDAAREIADVSAATGGVTLPDEGWVDLWGRPGRYGERLRVHGRDTCRTCGTATRSAVVGGRSARWCPACQPS